MLAIYQALARLALDEFKCTGNPTNSKKTRLYADSRGNYDHRPGMNSGAAIKNPLKRVQEVLLTCF